MLRVAMPSGSPAAPRQRFLFVLPVEPGEENRYGDGFSEIVRTRLHVRHRLVVVAPSFSDWPWYGDHPTDPRVRQESHLLRIIIPLVADLCPTADPRRLLLGFSKSGWGAMAMLLRHPDLFRAACAWDAPLMMDAPGRYNSGVVFPSRECFQGYGIPHLLERNAAAFRPAARIALSGCSGFCNDMRQAHDLLGRLGVPHIYIDRTRPVHAWDGGWVEESVDLLVAMTEPAGYHP